MVAMPKLSVYIPDELWDSVKKYAPPDTGGSQLVQDTLREFVDRRERRPYAVLSPELIAYREAALARSISKRTEAYQAGYAVGLSFAEYLTWELFTLLERVQWRLSAFAEETSEAEYVRANAGPDDEDQVFDFELAWRDAVESGASDSYVFGDAPDGIVREGFVQALKDLWAAESPVGDSTSPEPTPAAPALRATAATEEPVEGTIVPFEEGGTDDA
jgi:hypothetical protein